MIAVLQPRCALLAFLACLLLAPPILAQSILVANYKGKMYPVVSADGMVPCIEVGGKRMEVHHSSLGLAATAEFLPVFVSVSELYVGTRRVEDLSTGSSRNHSFQFRANFESPYALNDVFVVLYLDFGAEGRFYFVREVGRLKPHQSEFVSQWFPVARPLESGRWEFHLFAAGREVLQSNIPSAAREAILDRMVARRIAGLYNAKPALLVGPPADYPAQFIRTRVKGEVTVRCFIWTNGAVTSPTVIRATDPAFGAAALDAVRQWRFLPAVKDGQPVATSVELPLEFAPPDKP